MSQCGTSDALRCDRVGDELTNVTSLKLFILFYLIAAADFQIVMLMVVFYIPDL